MASDAVGRILLDHGCGFEKLHNTLDLCSGTYHMLTKKENGQYKFPYLLKDAESLRRKHYGINSRVISYKKTQTKHLFDCDNVTVRSFLKSEEDSLSHFIAQYKPT